MWTCICSDMHIAKEERDNSKKEWIVGAVMNGIIVAVYWQFKLLVRRMAWHGGTAKDAGKYTERTQNASRHPGKDGGGHADEERKRGHLI